MITAGQEMAIEFLAAEDHEVKPALQEFCIGVLTRGRTPEGDAWLADQIHALLLQNIKISERVLEDEQPEGLDNGPEAA